ncbi:hypothetical protein BC830DRAFT_1072014 [Chytriomyces sp. MP71]|nr:hypothetical protein BC830DRAFT_1072014 [Chytriomyces sp. MP71]
MFYACYLLQSQQGGQDGKCYIGSTPDPLRRIRQHNGEIQGGAYKTKMGRPWKMVAVVHGFPSRIGALQFEWAWQKPWQSRHLSACNDHSRGYFHLQTKLNVLADMLCVPQWRRWPLRVHFTSQAVYDASKLLGITDRHGTSFGDITIASFVICSTPRCSMISHIECIAHHFLRVEHGLQLVPVRGSCPACEHVLEWGDLMQIQHLREREEVGYVDWDEGETEKDKEVERGSDSD